MRWGRAAAAAAGSASARARTTVPARLSVTIKNLRFVERRRLARRLSPLEPPFLRGLTFGDEGQATWLVPRRGITVAGQRRNRTGFAGSPPAGDMCPAPRA